MASSISNISEVSAEDEVLDMSECLTAGNQDIEHKSQSKKRGKDQVGKPNCVLDVGQIQEILPHRYPFLLVDRVVELVLGEYIIATKLVSINEMYFNGHFPEKAVMPGVLVLEAMAQAAAILAKKSPGFGGEGGKEFVLVGADGVKWRRQVVPGDVLTIRVNWIKRKKTLLMVSAEAFVDGEVVAQGKIMAAETQF